MADGLDEAETVLRIGFLNDKLLERRAEYLGRFGECEKLERDGWMDSDIDVDVDTIM